MLIAFIPVAGLLPVTGFDLATRYVAYFVLDNSSFFFCARDSTEKAVYRLCRFSVSSEQTSGRPVVWQTD